MTAARINSRDKGAKGERDVAAYFREHGGPLCWAARRRVSTGTVTHADQGDIAGVPYLCLQVKALARPLTGKLLDSTWWATQKQATALMMETNRPAQPIIIEKRTGSADVGQWTAHLSTQFYVELVTGRQQLILRGYLVRTELGNLMPDIRLWLAEQHAKFK